MTFVSNYDYVIGLYCSFAPTTITSIQWLKRLDVEERYIQPDSRLAPYLWSCISCAFRE